MDSSQVHRESNCNLWISIDRERKEEGQSIKTETEEIVESFAIIRERLHFATVSFIDLHALSYISRALSPYLSRETESEFADRYPTGFPDICPFFPGTAYRYTSDNTRRNTKTECEVFSRFFFFFLLS